MKVVKKQTRDIEAESRSWNETEWEEYLQSLETPRREVLIDPRHFDSLADQQTIAQLFQEETGEGEQSIINQRVHEALNFLSIKEKQVIELIFWQGLTQEKAGQEMGVTRHTVQTYKERAMVKLKTLLGSNYSDFLENSISKDGAA